MAPTRPAAASRLPDPYRDEGATLALLMPTLAGLEWQRAVRPARPWVQAVRDTPAPFWALESLLREYPISSAEGLALMRLAEALLRVPDAATAIALTADQLGRADFGGAASDGPHKLLASLSASAIALSKKFLPEHDAPAGVMQRLGAATVVAATVRALQLLGRQFVLGQDIDAAMAEADALRRGRPDLRFSYDMLGEGARSEADAARYFESYANALRRIGAAGRAAAPQSADGISIKLSALFSRYEEAQRERVFAELSPRVEALIDLAAGANLNLTIDAEESDRLELSLDLLDAWAACVAARHPGWTGFGLAVQAYQTRALDVVHAVASIARRHGLRFMVRLVKGAYWDTEIKRAQELGLPGYPVFTHKHHTDIAYLACARALLAHPDVLYSQFATHNAGTIAAILEMAGDAAFELQRLHGMGEAVYREVSRYSAPPSASASAVMTTTPPAPPAGAGGLTRGRLPLRVYAPVGRHRDLLAYLVRRLLENGANSSFVHQLADARVDVETLLASPLHPAARPGIAAPVDLFGTGARRNSAGLDLACAAHLAPLQAALAATRIEPVDEATPAAVDAAMQRLHTGFEGWSATPLAERAAVLRRCADRLEAELPAFCGLLVTEAKKTLADAVSEVREAVDFCRYYADEATANLAPRDLPGPTGESNRWRLHGRGVFVCISPWNFPLAIFTGQVAAALVAGNAVAAKPAEQTPAVAARLVALLHAAGVPAQALALLHGPGESVGAALVAHPLTAGVCFTGSTAVARHINRALAAKDGPIVPLIAETGGLNAMLVDSSALPEQVIDAVLQSAFRSAGQRCSALRLLCVHEGVADAVLEMLRGALAELRLGDPGLLATDVGPVIDREAFDALSSHVARLRGEARLVGESPHPSPAQALRFLGNKSAGRSLQRSLPEGEGEGKAQGSRWHFIAPVAFEIASIADLKEEVFGPVLHIVRWSGDPAAVIAQVNALGYGLTLGIQTRIDSRALRLAGAARVGNVYVNRNMVGAVVGVQPFGGEGLSGTGPKAGGPLYLTRFCAEQTLTINTAAAGGNAALFAGPPSLG